jgi:methionyl-tRNA formyltransferase
MKGDALLAELEIRKFDDPSLRKKARPVVRVNNGIRKTLDDMLESMRSAKGVGLAAPQVGISKRIVVIDLGDEPYFLVNPDIVYRSDETETKWEGCLSWPGYVGEVERPLRVSVKALDRDGHDIWVEGEGLLARALCHEIDHLDGILFVDKAKAITEVTQDDTEEDEDVLPFTCVFMGSPEFAVPCLDELVCSGVNVPLVVTQPDRPYGRKKVLTPTPVKARAQELGIEVLTPENMASPEVVQRLSELAPDFIAVAAFGQKLPGEVLEMPKYGCLNVHPSLLPRYRGGNPVQRQIMAGEQISGVSIIYMSERMDAGDICIQKQISIGPNETFGTLEKRLSVLGAHALLEAVILIYSGTAKRTVQNEKERSLAFHLKPGEEVIDWKEPAKKIHNLVRGLSPVPGSVTVFGDERIKIWQTQLVIPDEFKASGEQLPGTILGIHDEMVVVMCGHDVIGVLEVQPSGKTRMTAKSFLMGRQKGINRFG